MSGALVAWVLATFLGLIVIAVVVAIVDNRVNYGRWFRRRTSAQDLDDQS